MTLGETCAAKHGRQPDAGPRDLPSAGGLQRAPASIGTTICCCRQPVGAGLEADASDQITGSTRYYLPPDIRTHEGWLYLAGGMICYAAKLSDWSMNSTHAHFAALLGMPC